MATCSVEQPGTTQHHPSPLCNLTLIKSRGKDPLKALSIVSLCPIGPAFALVHVDFLYLEYDTFTLTPLHTQAWEWNTPLPLDWGLPTCSGKSPNLGITLRFWPTQLALGLRCELAPPAHPGLLQTAEQSPGTV